MAKLFLTSAERKIYFLASIQTSFTCHANFKVASAIPGGTEVQPSILGVYSGKQLSDTQMDKSLPHTECARPPDTLYKTAIAPV